MIFIDDNDSMAISPSRAYIGAMDKAKLASKKKRKVVTVEEVIVALEKTSTMIEKATDTLGAAIINVAKIYEDAIRNEDVVRSEKKMKINGELRKLSGLTMEDRHTTTRRIGRDVDLTDIFFRVEDDEKEAWVKSLLKENIDKLRASRSAVSVADIANDFTLGVEGEAFGFSQCHNKVTVVEATGLTGEITRAEEFIREYARP